MDLQERRHLVGGMGDTFSRSVEFVVTPLILALAGHGLDRWLGTSPLLAVVLGLVGVIGMFVRTWYGYVQSMEAAEADRPWVKR